MRETMDTQVCALDLAGWTPAPDAAITQRVADILETGKVLYLPRLAFRLAADEQRFLDPRWSDGRAKNISWDPERDVLKGARGGAADLAALRVLLARFQRQAAGLVAALLPRYVPFLRSARTSLRTQVVAMRRTSWRKDDSRLHVDAFPSRPTEGTRILRVFANVNPHGSPRVWRVGAPFPDVAARFWPRLHAPLWGSAALMAALHITKRPRSRYDHYMLQLHDAMKRDLDYQRAVAQTRFAFEPGSVWVCFSDQTSHAAVSGQYLLEQTLHLALEGLYDRGSAPLAVLERLASRPLVRH